MANYMVTDSQLSSIANAIRSKGGTSASLAFPTGFVSAINQIQDVAVYKGVFLERNISEATFRGVSYLPVSAITGNSAITSLAFPDCVEAGVIDSYYTPSVRVGSIITYCENLYSVDFPELLEIPSMMFIGCYNLTDISFPKATKIQTSAFYCNYYGTGGIPSSMVYKFTKAIFPQVTTIGSSAFYNCIFLNEISFPKLQSIGSNAFYSCSGITKAFLPTVDFVSVSMNFLGWGSLSELTLANNITTLPNNAFYGCYFLSSVNINFSQLTSIGQGAFQGCWNLSSLDYFSNSLLTEIPSYAFSSCGSYNYDYYSGSFVYFSNGPKNIYLPNVSKVGYGAFGGCCQLSHITLSSNVIIQTGAFSFCNFLELSETDFPSTVNFSGNSIFASNYFLSKVSFSTWTNIPNYMFAFCSSLTQISFPNVTSIGQGAFQGCYSLSNIYFPQVTQIGGQAFANNASIKKISDANFPKMSDVLPDYIFSNCYSLSQVSFSKITTINLYAFRNCFSLAQISFPNVTSIGQGAFQACSALTQLTNEMFPKLISVASSVFTDCSNLIRINLSSLSNLMGMYTFAFCYQLSEVILPNITNIRQNTFQRCSALSVLEFPNVQFISGYAFSNCDNLTTLSLPGLSSLYTYAFYYCSKLTSIYLYGSSVPSLGSSFNYIFSSRASVINIYVKASMYNSFRTAYRWSNYSSRIFSVPD